jgi:hypothetical protein
MKRGSKKEVVVDWNVRHDDNEVVDVVKALRVDLAAERDRANRNAAELEDCQSLARELKIARDAANDKATDVENIAAARLRAIEELADFECPLRVDAEADQADKDLAAQVELLQAPGWDCVCGDRGYCDFCDPKRALAEHREDDS